MNYTIIFAGGIGSRMGSSMPKQFLEVDGKPVLVHAIEHFERHGEIDGIVVVSNKDWIDYSVSLIKRYKLSKVLGVVPGGETGQLSIFNGLNFLVNTYMGVSLNDIVLVHDGVRPVITEKLITDSIAVCKKYGNCIAVSKAIETIIKIDSGGKMKELIDRSVCRYAKAPQCFKIADLWEAHQWAMNHGYVSFIDSAALMSANGHTLYTTECGAENIKITTPNDFYTFEALYHANKNKSTH